MRSATHEIREGNWNGSVRGWARDARGRNSRPKTLEHIVDTVLYFEGEGTLDHRVLRAIKNRFGSVDEIGVFRMTQNASTGRKSFGAIPR